MASSPKREDGRTAVTVAIRPIRRWVSSTASISTSETASAIGGQEGVAADVRQGLDDAPAGKAVLAGLGQHHLADQMIFPLGWNDFHRAAVDVGPQGRGSGCGSG